MKLHFLGGARVVTGANYLLEVSGKKFLIECGLFQGSQEIEDMNYNPFPFDPARIDALFITHSHLDHCGRVPRLIKDGFRSPIYCTNPTRDIMEPSLRDTAKINQERAKELNYPPLFGAEHVDAMIRLIQGQSYHEPLNITPNVTVTFYNAGHILGSAMIEFQITEQGKKKRLLFTGDLGNCPNPILPNTDKISRADYVCIESAYGDRLHESQNNRKDLLKQAIIDIVKRKGVLLIPSFAIERTQELLYHINTMVEHKEIPSVPIFIDSPLATKITAVYKGYESYFNTSTRSIIRSGDDIFNFPRLEFTESIDASKQINNRKPPKIIIAGSGMSTGGRILHHEKRYLSDPKNIFLVVGFQVNGTLGRKIMDGEPIVHILDEKVHNRIEVRAIGGYSAHADQKQLVNILKQISPAPKRIFIVQGEFAAARGLKKALNRKLGLAQQVEIPIQGEVFTL